MPLVLPQSYFLNLFSCVPIHTWKHFLSRTRLSPAWTNLTSVLLPHMQKRTIYTSHTYVIFVSTTSNTPSSLLFTKIHIKVYHFWVHMYPPILCSAIVLLMMTKELVYNDSLIFFIFFIISTKRDKIGTSWKPIKFSLVGTSDRSVKLEPDMYLKYKSNYGIVYILRLYQGKFRVPVSSYSNARVHVQVPGTALSGSMKWKTIILFTSH